MAYTFRPVRGEEHKIKATTPTEGFLYFSTDTKKIFMAKDGQFVPMGGNSGIYYGSRELTDEEKEDTELTTFIFTPEDIEGEQNPNINDLILNIPDGCFYRVTFIGDAGLVTTEKLTIAGSGGGSGPGGGGDTPTVKVSWQELSPTKDFVVGDKEMLVSFKLTALNNLENNKIEKVIIAIGSTILKEVVKTYEFGDIITVDIADVSDKLSKSTPNTLKVTVLDSYSQEYKPSTSLGLFTNYRLHQLELSSDFSTIYKMIDSTVIPYPCRPNGGSGLTNRYIRVTIAPIDNPTAYIFDESTTVKNTNIDLQIPVNVAEKCSHGVYILSASFCALLSDGKVISSPASTHQIIFYETSVNTPLIAAHVPEVKLSQYDSSIITYMIVDEQSIVAEVDVTLWTENDTSVVKATLGQESSWKKMFNKTGFYQLAIEYGNQKELLPKIEVVPYEGELPTIDETNMELYLTSQGRSNTEAAKDTWVYKNIQGKFENFLWGNANGWIEDDGENVALKLTNGAKFSLPTYYPFAVDATDQGLTIELDFMFSGVLDYSKPLIECLSYLNDGKIATGFHITGQKATLNSSVNKATTMVLEGEEDSSGNINETDMALQAFTQYYNENERIHLSYVIERIPPYENIKDNSFYFVYTYLNGVLSGIMKLKVDKENKSKEQFKESSPATIVFDSTYGDINIYNIRVYRTALDSRTIINNYIADLTNIDEKMELYKINNIYTDEGLINLKAIQDFSYQLKVPYVLFKGGSKMPKKFKDAITYSEVPTYQLPLTKSDYRLMSMEMWDRTKDNEKPVFEVPIDLEASNGAHISDFKDIAVGESYSMKRGVQVYGQGTSSMVYPVKNLRLKFRDEDDYPTVYNGSYPVEIVCFKADFMDSSASHNTGTANLIYDLLKGMNLYSPAQAFKNENSGKEGVAEYDLVTAIRGFPIVCFYATGDSDDYIYIGRYNFNLDKATPEPFGFFPQKFYTGKSVVDDNGFTRNEVKCVGLKTETVKGMTVLPIDEEGKEIERDIIQCWEVLNNDTGSPTKFLTSRDYLQKVITAKGIAWSDTKNYFRDFGPGELFKESLKFADTDGKKYGWMDYYEDRYPDAMVGGGAAALGDKDEDPYDHLDEDLENGLFRLTCWINSTALPLEGDDPVANEVSYRAIEPAYYPTRDEAYDPAKTYYIKENGEYVEKVITLTNGVLFETGVIGSPDASNLDDININQETFEAKVNNVLGEYTFVYSAETGTWALDNGEVVGENLEDYGITFSKTPNNAVFIKVSYYQTSDWAKTLLEKYTIDNENYRLAKFKAEFEDYFNLDFALFYYVLTMLLLMMDSRAKNMMLASWDQKIWYPIFYDMDTALGVNNTGFNKFAYDTEDDPADKVFNGFDSVLWNNFRACFYSDICKFYSDLRKNLNIGKLLKTYNADASDKWNEALTTADAEYKYVRPYEEGYYDGKNTDDEGNPVFVTPGKTSYLYAGQGKRTNHRSYWLRNRMSYFDSKYIPPTLNPKTGITVDAFNFRAYALPEQQSSAKTAECIAQTPADHHFTLTALNNSYQSIYIGNILYGPVYTQANQKVELGPSQVKHEVESYILNPELISDLGDLSDKYLGQFNFPSAKTRLIELKFGRSSRSHANKYDKYYNNLLSSLSIGDSCPYLQKINIARCTGLKEITLTGCPRLRVIDAEGCKLTDISFPANSILEKAYLPKTLTSLTLTNQPYLTEIRFDDDDIVGATKSIQSVTFDRVPLFDSYPIVAGVFKDTTAKTFYLTNVNWVIDDEDDFVVEDDRVTGIKILDALKVAYPKDGYSTAQALTGTITVNVAKTISQFDIYEKYTKVFPNVTILYGDDVDLERAKEIRFFSDEGVSEPYFTVYTDGTRTMAELVSASGPGGKDLTNPTKASTDTNSFEFAGCWICDGDEIPVETFSSFTPSTSMDLYPKYNVVERKYNVKFYDWDSSIAVDDEVPYGTSLAALPNYRYRDSSNLDIYERWSFQGWSTVKYSDGPVNSPSYLDLSNLIVTKDIVAYAHYIKEDVREVATRDEYFDFVLRNDIKIPFDEPLDGNELRSEYREGYQISIKEKYKSSLAGKITLPSEYNGKPIISVGDCVANNITHVFFLKDCDTYLEISGSAFTSIKGDSYQCKSLVAVYAPSSIVKIGKSAFEDTVTLEHFSFNDGILEISDRAFRGSSMMSLVVNELPASLRKLGSQAFWYVNNITVTKLPKNLEIIPGQVFYSGSSYDVNNISITRFENNIRKIESGALRYVGGAVQENTLYFGPSVVSIGDRAFGDYNGNNAHQNKG